MNTGEIFLKQVVDYFQKKHSGSIVPIDGHSLEKSQSGRIVQLVYGECVRFSLDNSYLDCVVSNGVKVDKNGLMPDLESSLAAFSIPHEYDHEELSKFTAGTVIRNLEIVRINDGKMSFK